MLFLFAVCCAAWVAPRAALGQTEVQAEMQAEFDPDQAAVESGRKALRSSNSYPWYDSKNDSLRRIDVRPDKSAENLNRKSQWQSRPAPPPRTPNWNWNWPVFPTWLVYLLYFALTSFGLAVFGLLVWLLVKAFLNQEKDDEAAPSGSDAAEVRGDVDRIENLPFQVKRPQSDLRGEAEHHFRAGNYREAIVYLYSYLLLQLDRRQVIRLTKGKTNRQYLREVRQRPELVPIFEPTMIAFEDVFFGDHPISRAEFENCWNRLDEFHRLLDLTQQVAA